MLENPLGFNLDNDPTLVTLTEEQQDKLNSMILKIDDEISSIFKKFQLRTIDKKVIDDFENSIDDFLMLFEYDKEVAKERKGKDFEISKVNFQNQQMENMLSLPVTKEDVREKLKNLTDYIKKWWKIHGFGHISKVNFLERTVEVKFSGMVFQGFDLNGNEISEKDNISRLKEKGFEFGDDKDLIDSENNRNLLYQIITESFPKSYPTDVKLWWGRKKEPIIRDFTFHIDYSSIVINEEITAVDFKYESILTPNKNAPVLVRFGKKLSEINFVIKQIVEGINNKTLKVGYFKTLLSCLNNYAIESLEIIDIQGKLKVRQESIYKDIREANSKNHNLRKLLGNKVTIDIVAEQIKQMSGAITKWWDEDGLGYSKILRFYEYGCEVELNCNMSDRYFYRESDGKEFERNILEKVESLGIEFINERIEDSEKSRTLLKEIISERFPNSDIESVNTNLRYITSIVITIRDLDEI